jgi:hypothetical protein
VEEITDGKAAVSGAGGMSFSASNSQVLIFSV